MTDIRDPRRSGGLLRLLPAVCVASDLAPERAGEIAV